MIDKLTPCQEQKIEEYRNEWIEVGLRTKPLDREKVKNLICELYEIFKYKKPEIIFLPSPKACVEKAKALGSADPKWWYGNHNCNWVAYFKYFVDVLGFSNENQPLFDNIIGITRECHWMLMYDTTCIVSDHPIEINRNQHGLHADGKAALRYSDGYSLWVLNGIKVPQYLVETPAGNLDIDFFLKEKNIDVKAEFIKKYGIDRMVKLGKVIDTYKNYKNKPFWERSEYQLIDMVDVFKGILPKTKFAPFLYMKNQTMAGVYHLEGIHPSCRTIKQALDWQEELDQDNYDTIFIKQLVFFKKRSLK